MPFFTDLNSPTIEQHDALLTSNIVPMYKEFKSMFLVNQFRLDIFCLKIHAFMPSIHKQQFGITSYTDKLYVTKREYHMISFNTSLGWSLFVKISTFGKLVGPMVTLSTEKESLDWQSKI